MHNAEEHRMSTDTRIESLETQVRTLKRMLFGVFGLVVVGGLLAATNFRAATEVRGQSAEFDTVTTKKLVIESHAGDPWLVAEEILVEPDAPEIGGNQLIRIGRRSSSFTCWLDARGGIQMWIKDGDDRERMNFIVRGGPNDFASMQLLHPEAGTKPAFEAFSCNKAYREELEQGLTVGD
jgi:hypothetical protein